MYPLRFVHIPHTISSVFPETLSRIYANARHFTITGNPHLDTQNFAAIPILEQSQYSIFTGSAPAVYPGTPFDNLQTLTFLCDPVERTKRACQFAYEQHLKLNSTSTFNLETYLNDPEQNYHLENLQTQYLVGYEFYKTHRDKPQTLAQKAIDNLIYRIDAFGIVDQYPHSLILFKNKFDWPHFQYAPLQDTKPAQALSYNADTIQKVFDLNTIDIDIYQRAKHFFEITLSRVPDLKSKMTALDINLACQEFDQDPPTYLAA